MKTILQLRRQKLLRELMRVNHQITQTQQQLTRLESRLALASQPRGKAA